MNDETINNGMTTCQAEPQQYLDYNIEIRDVNNGYIVNVGCQQFVFTNINDMMLSIQKYLKNKVKYQKQYLSKTITFKHGVLE